MKLYHFTGSAHLPWILQSGELRPGRNKIGGYPDPDFLWATANDRGDATASGTSGEFYRTGRVRQVRFTLDSEGFFPWREVNGRFPAWTKQFRDELEGAAKGRSDPKEWWCRETPLPLTDAIEIHTRSYSDNQWRPLTNREVVPMKDDSLSGMWLAILIGNKTFASKSGVGPQGQSAYEIRVA